MTKLAIIHTTPATIDSLKTLAAEIIPGCQVINFLDDSILPQLAENGGNLDEIRGRFLRYFNCAEDAGADIILEACSSVGELAAEGQDLVRVPVVRIDDAMAEEAVRRGSRVGIAATVATTLNPTTRLIRTKAEAAGKAVDVEPVLVAEAYRRLMAGDRSGHDQLLASALLDLVRRVDVVVLAQASMARMVDTLPEDVRGKFLSSPRLGMQRVRRALEAKDG